MKIFLDTSILFKLYYLEAGSAEIKDFIIKNTTSIIFIAEISRLEFISTVWKKVRTKQIEINDADTIISNFEKDEYRYSFVKSDDIIINRAKQLLSKYGLDGLRTLDSIQLSCCLEIRSETDKYFTADKLLINIFEKENLPT